MSYAMRVAPGFMGVRVGICILSGTADAQQNSGFLGENYSKRQDAQSPSGAQGLKPYQVIPVAFVFAMAKKAGGNASREASLSVEFEARTPEPTIPSRHAARHRGVQESNRQGVTRAVVKPVIDGWAKDARLFFQPRPEQ
jgi:hypothetical protein